MIKQWFKFFVISLFSICIITSSVIVNASASTNNNDDEIVKQFTGDLLIDSKERLTVSDSGGSVTMEYASKNRSIEWVVRPKGGLPFEFIGFINISGYSGATVKSYPISGFGSYSASGSVSLYGAYNLRVGTMYTAKMIGNAINTAGTKFYVTDNVKITFKYGY